MKRVWLRNWGAIWLWVWCLHLKQSRKFQEMLKQFETSNKALWFSLVKFNYANMSAMEKVETERKVCGIKLHAYLGLQMEGETW